KAFSARFLDGRITPATGNGCWRTMGRLRLLAFPRRVPPLLLVSRGNVSERPLPSQIAEPTLLANRPRKYLLHHARLGLGVLVHIGPVAAGQFALHRSIQLAVGRAAAQMIAERHVADELFATG